MGCSPLAPWRRAGGASSHVQTRLEAWLVPFENYETTGYQISNGIFAMASGSLSGTGLGLGRPSLIAFAPTDFIFAAVGEELGLVGSVLILAMYALIISVGMGVHSRVVTCFASSWPPGSRHIRTPVAA